MYDDDDKEDLEMSKEVYRPVMSASSVLSNSNVSTMTSSLKLKSRKRKTKSKTTKSNVNNDDVLAVFTFTVDNFCVATELIDPTNNGNNGVDENNIDKNEDIHYLESMKKQLHIDEINPLTKLSNKMYKKIDEYPPRLNWVQLLGW